MGGTPAGSRPCLARHPFQPGCRARPKSIPYLTKARTYCKVSRIAYKLMPELLVFPTEI
jgi:hypothetical protein